MFNSILSTLFGWIPKIVKALSKNKKLADAVDRVEKLKPIELTREVRKIDKIDSESYRATVSESKIPTRRPVSGKRNAH